MFPTVAAITDERPPHIANILQPLQTDCKGLRLTFNLYFTVRFIDPAKGDGLLTRHLNKDVRRVLIVFIHGVGDVVMFIEVFKAIRTVYPKVHFDLGLSKELDQNNIYPCAVVLDTDWKSQVSSMNYDLVFQSRFPMEDPQRPMVTKAEICCEKELGIPPIAKYPELVPKKIVAVHFQSTAVPELANAPEIPAQRIWKEIALAGSFPSKRISSTCATTL